MNASAPSDPVAELPAVAPPRDARRRRWLAGVVTFVYALLLALAMGRHEMWRDEIQAWLLARDTPNWLGILQTIRYEGHPGLWHLLLWPLAHLSWNPVWMQVLHGAIASGAVWTLVRFAPFAWPVRALLPFGYILFYEWGVISRNYALSALLLLLFCTAFAARWRRFPWAAAALAAACHTNVHSLLLVIVLFPLLVIDFAVAVAGRFRDAHRFRWRVVLSFALVAVGIGTAVRQVSPPPDTGFATPWTWTWQPEHATQAALTFVRAHVPIPVAVKAGFWNSNRLVDRPPPGSESAERRPRLARNALLLGLLLAATVLFRRPWPLVHWVAGTLALLVFFYVKYMGSMRHHAFHWLWAIVLLWLALGYVPWSTGRPRLDRAFGRLESLLINGLLLVSAAFQIWGCAVAVRADAAHPFSGAKAAADWLRSEKMITDRNCFAGQRGPEVSAVVGYAQLSRIYYTGRNEWGSYMVWDDRYTLTLGPRRLVGELRAFRDREAKDLVFVSSEPVPAHIRPPELREVASFDFPGASDTVWIYVWPLPPAPAP